ncbi:MAG TPA: 4'-phosphopantetheinyl transferase superfamily protein [Lutibacter sp.]|nr:4'-phosphopantetheinyl transferase superfamily protein [Lutibacter sp.]
MIGNDLVDLKLAAKQSNWQRKGFLDKLFTPIEQEYILDSDNPFETVWLLWSMKESAYKAYLQTHKERFFAPKNLACHLTSKNKGTVLINNTLFFTESEIGEDFIYTMAFTKNRENNFLSNCFEFDQPDFETQHSQTYQKVLAVFAKKLKLEVAQLKIEKNVQGVPQLFQGEMLLDYSFSMTHHGQFGAFCIGA